MLAVVVKGGSVVAVTVVGGVVVVVVVLESFGSQILNLQKLGSVMGADSGPLYGNILPISMATTSRPEHKIHTTELHSTGHT